MTKDNRQEFQESWDKLLKNMTKLINITDTNRRLLAGVTALLIKKEILSPADVKQIEHMVFGKKEK